MDFTYALFTFLSKNIFILIYILAVFSIINKAKKMKKQSSERMNPYSNAGKGFQQTQPNPFNGQSGQRSVFGSGRTNSSGSAFGTTNPMNQGNLGGPQKRNNKKSPFGTTNPMNQGNLRGPQKQGSRKSPFGSTNPMSQGNQFGTTKDPFTKDARIEIKDVFCIFNRGEVDCGLDERIFGSRNQKKDVF